MADVTVMSDTTVLTVLPSLASAMLIVTVALDQTQVTAYAVLKVHTVMKRETVKSSAVKTVLLTALNATRLDPSRPLPVLNVRTDTSLMSSPELARNATIDVRPVTDQTATTVPLVSQASIMKTPSVKNVT